MFAYAPNHFDTRLKTYIQEDIVDKNRDQRTDDEKKNYETKITEFSKDLSPRRTRHMEELLSYRNTKKTVVAGEDAPMLIELSWIKVIEDGKGALNMRS